MSGSRKIVVFGGSFSPPTLAHEAIIARCLQLPQFDEVWVLPSGSRPDKTIAMQDEDRLAMLKLVHQQIFAADKRLAVSDFELHLPRPSQTYRTSQELAHTFPNVQFWFAFGRDAYNAMPSWPHGEELRKMLRVVVFGDETSSPPNGKQLQYIALDSRFSDMSSTGARQALVHSQSLEGLVSKPVAHYLKSFTLESPSLPTPE